MNLKVTILPAKALADGTHRVRIAMSHRGTTRYFLTRFVVPSPKNVTNGNVVGIPNANYMNQKLLQRMTDIYKAYDEMEDTDYLSCSQLLSQIETKIKGGEPKTLYAIIDEFVTNKEKGVSSGTMRIVSFAVREIKRFFDDAFFLKNLDSKTLYAFRDFMTKDGQNASTQSIYFQVLREIINYAVRHKYVEYEVYPFADFEEPKSLSRNIAVSVEELRTIRDKVFTGKFAKQLAYVRDLFMLSFYLCGMNLIDMLRMDYSGDYLHFLRHKTMNRRPDELATEFTIQPEARAILDRIYKDGKFVFNDKSKTFVGYSAMLNRYMPMVAEQCGIKRRLIYYSARKTFAQMANELMIKDSIIEFCIGDAVTTNRKVIGAYMRVNKRMADAAIRKVLDAAASTKSMDAIVEETGI
jgi:hypothetical protein